MINVGTNTALIIDAKLQFTSGNQFQVTNDTGFFFKFSVPNRSSTKSLYIEIPALVNCDVFSVKYRDPDGWRNLKYTRLLVKKEKKGFLHQNSKAREEAFRRKMYQHHPLTNRTW